MIPEYIAGDSPARELEPGLLLCASGFRKGMRRRGVGRRRLRHLTSLIRRAEACECVRWPPGQDLCERSTISTPAQDLIDCPGAELRSSRDSFWQDFVFSGRNNPLTC